MRSWKIVLVQPINSGANIEIARGLAEGRLMREYSMRVISVLPTCAMLDDYISVLQWKISTI